MTFKTIQPYIPRWQRIRVHVEASRSSSRQFPRSGPQKERPFCDVITDAHEFAKVRGVPDSGYIAEIQYDETLCGQRMWMFEWEFKA